MNTSRLTRTGARLLGAGAVLAVAAYGSYVGVAWCRYGHPQRPVTSEEADPLLERCMPTYEVVERHRVRIDASAAITFSAACEMDIQSSSIVRAIFRSRELILGSHREENNLPRGLVAQMKALGWGVLAEIPEREILMGAVTQPWEANVVFRPLPPEEFAAFQEPGYVKIVWTLRADPIGSAESVFRTETRVATTDARARAKFRLYWSFFSPGIALIRRMLLGPLKSEAERRAREAKYIGQHSSLIAPC
jgi:hypothetical protein